jgi:hypothetical protein
MVFHANTTCSWPADDVKLALSIENDLVTQRIISTARAHPCISSKIRQLDDMSKDESGDFKPRLGKPRGQSRKAPRTTVALILRSVAEQGGDLRRLSRPIRERKPSGRFNARGRGRAAAAALAGHGGWEVDPGTLPGIGMRYRARRVVVKARVVKLKGVESQAVAAHLRYLQREGVTLDGQRGHAYSALEDQADTKDFLITYNRTP